MGKLGAAISTLFFPVLLASWGKYDLMAFLGIVAIIGAILTFFILPETKNKSLEETSKEASIRFNPA
jgi:Na+/melibiose symporter-like transporter